MRSIRQGRNSLTLTPCKARRVRRARRGSAGDSDIMGRLPGSLCAAVPPGEHWWWGTGVQAGHAAPRVKRCRAHQYFQAAAPRWLSDVCMVAGLAGAAAFLRVYIMQTH